MKGSLTKMKGWSKSSKKQHTLLLFLLISSLFWFLTKLSKEYETKAIYKVNYINIPTSKLFQNSPETSVELIIKSSGFNLLKEKFRKNRVNIGIRNMVAGKEKYSYFLLTDTKKSQVQGQLKKEIELIGFTKDTLFFELGFNKRKKIPVINNFDFRFKSGFNISEKIIVKPDSIEVSGPEIQVDKINSVKTSLLKIDEIVEDIYYEVSLDKKEELNKINYSHDKVKVIGQVEKFTEDSFQVPFEIIGLPENIEITTYPKTIEVVYQVGLSNYKKIAALDFKIVCNYNKSLSDSTRFLVPELVKKPSLVSSIKMIPNQIEFLIKK